MSLTINESNYIKENCISITCKSNYKEGPWYHKIGLGVWFAIEEISPLASLYTNQLVILPRNSIQRTLATTRYDIKTNHAL